MKKLFELLIVILLAVSMTACGSSGKEEPAPEGNDIPVEETETGESETEEMSDEELIEVLKERLIGEWHYPGIDEERLIFNNDKTGTHDGIYAKQEFTYTVSIDHKEYGNGKPYINYMLHMKYDTGEEEDIIFFFNEERETMAFHNSEDGGYSGVLGFEEWIKNNELNH